MLLCISSHICICADEYEASTVSEPVVEEKQDTGSLTVSHSLPHIMMDEGKGRLTGTHSPPPLMRDDESLLSSCSRANGRYSFVEHIDVVQGFARH